MRIQPAKEKWWEAREDNQECLQAEEGSRRSIILNAAETKEMSTKKDH